MRTDGQRESENVEDRRGQGGGGRSPLALRGGGGILGIIVIAVMVYLKGGNLGDFIKLALQQPQAQQQQRQQGDPQAPLDPEQEALKKFVAVVLADTEDVWAKQFAAMGDRYEKPKLVLFSGEVSSACGQASASVGPFYCPGDSKVYLDLQFYEDMETKLNSKGDFAKAYVVAHEVGHHVQNLLGITEKVDAMRGGPQENQYSVRLELQADYLAGVWAHHANKMRDMIETGDIEEAINCAKQIGDDTLQSKGQGYVVPEKFTHGSSKQRAYWFNKGFKTGKMSGANELFELDYEDLSRQ